jgi:hypothetical protein
MGQEDIQKLMEQCDRKNGSYCMTMHQSRNGVTATQFSAYRKTAMLYHPSYLPDQTLASYFLFLN